MLVHNWSGCHRDDGFRGGWAVAQSTVWSLGVVVFPPLFDQDFGFPQRVDELAVQQFIAKPCVESFAVSILPGRPWLYVGGLSADRCNSIADSLNNELWAGI